MMHAVCASGSKATNQNVTTVLIATVAKEAFHSVLLVFFIRFHFGAATGVYFGFVANCGWGKCLGSKVTQFVSGRSHCDETAFFALERMLPHAELFFAAIITKWWWVRRTPCTPQKWSITQLMSRKFRTLIRRKFRTLIHCQWQQQQPLASLLTTEDGPAITTAKASR
jgi:hypothetical protein